MLHKSSTMDSLVIYVSENKNIVSLFSIPAVFMIFYKSSTQPLESTWIVSEVYAMNEANAARLFLPLPPTPTSSACPNVVVMTLTILITC